METPTVDGLAPGVPPDYYQSIADAEEAHWWHRGMLAISAALLGPRLAAGGRALDAGCGTGGFLRFLAQSGRFTALSGTDIASTAIGFARERVPEANLVLASLSDLPFGDDSFDLIAVNDVLQHVPEAEVDESLVELRRVLAPAGTLLVRTNGSRHFRQERDDWRVYDRSSLAAVLADAGFQVERVTYANTLLSLAAAGRGRVPHAPTDERHGVPQTPGKLPTAVGSFTLGIERGWLGSGGTLPYGHTLFALSRPSS
jgi:ubiquinone/menaquinone biosynthesis C-methylase UbiE